MERYYKIAIWAAIIGTLFLIAWRKGYLARLSNYVGDTRDELKKCTWPTWAELRGSTAVVGVAIVLLGAFVVVVDLMLGYLVRLLIT